jgi:biotin transport system substrate-specific component
MHPVLAEALIKRRSLIVDLSLILGGSLFVAAMAQLSISLMPFSPVPITGQTFAVLLLGMAFGARRGALTMVAYLLEGAAGLPVFAEAKSGVATVLGPTGGYIVGFIAAAWVVGKLAERGFDRDLFKTLAAMVVGNIVIYAFGIAWLSRFVPGLDATLAAGMYPFLLGDAVKAVLAALLLPSAWKLLGDK